MSPSEGMEMYGDLCELLVPGFLSTSLDVDGHRFGLRSLSQNDLHYLHKYVRDDDLAWRIHLAAHSIWMVDGIPLIGEPLSHRVLYDHLLRASRSILGAIVGTAYGFFSRMREANNYLEAYLYEDDSRRLWQGIGCGTYPIHTKSSIHGIERLGLNPIQSAWVSWNKVTDTRDDQEYTWSNTKVLVSLQSNKGYNSLNNKDKSRQDREDSRRVDVRNRAMDRFMYGEVVNEGQPTGRTVQRARTNDELEEEMRRWIKGDLDWHDQIVDAYKNRIRDEQLERENQKLEILSEMRANRDAEEHDLGAAKPILRPITPEQMAEMLKNNGKSGTRFITEADPVSRTFNRYLRPTVEAGNLSVDASGRILERPASVEAKDSLSDRVAARRVVLDAD